MVACNDPTGDRSAILIRNYAVLLASVPLLSTWLGMTSTMFAVEGTLLNAYFLYLTHRFSKQHSNANARRIFLTSLWYLPLLLAGYVFYNRNWDSDNVKDIERKKIEKVDGQGPAPVPAEADSALAVSTTSTKDAAVLTGSYTNTRLTELVAERMDSAREALRGVCLHEMIVTEKTTATPVAGEDKESTSLKVKNKESKGSHEKSGRTRGGVLSNIDTAALCPVHLMPRGDKSAADSNGSNSSNTNRKSSSGASTER